VSATFKHRLIVWFWDGLTAAGGGVTNTLIALFGVDVANNISPRTIATFTPHQIWVMLGSSFLVSWAMYYKQRRPPSIDTVPGDVETPTEK
jgi:hypothetical protein